MIKWSVAFLLVVIPAQASEPNTWSIMELNKDKVVVRVLHNLTRHECEFVRNRIKGLPATPQEVAVEKAKEEKQRQEEEQAEIAYHLHRKVLEDSKECQLYRQEKDLNKKEAMLVVSHTMSPSQNDYFSPCGVWMYSSSSSGNSTWVPLTSDSDSEHKEATDAECFQ